MKIEFEISNPDGTPLDEDRINQLAASLGIEDLDELGPLLAKLSKAGIAEYIEMLSGRGMANRADEAKQDRLLHIIKHYFSPFLPAEDEISIMFQLTTTQSKTLLRNTLSRYRTRLRDELHQTLEVIYKDAEWGKDGYDVTINSDVFVEHLNLIIAQAGADYNPIRKRSVGSRKYFVTIDSYNALGDHFGA